MKNLEDHGGDDGLCGDLEEFRRRDCSDEDDPEDDGPRDPLALSNPRLAAFIRRVTPSYAWEPPIVEEDFDEIHLPHFPHYVPLRKGASVLIAGRGMVNTSFQYPAYYAEAVHWWLGKLRWIASSSLASLSAAVSSVTQLELVIDFEMSTGLRLGMEGACETSWSGKAHALVEMIKALVRIHTVYLNGSKTTYKQAFQPRPNVSALAPLGAPAMAGYARRPVWVCERTPQVAAANVWRAKAEERLARGSVYATAASTRTRAFAKEWEITYSHFPADDKWGPKAQYDLEQKIGALKRKREQQEQPGARQSRPQPLPPHRAVPSAEVATSQLEPPPTGTDGTGLVQVAVAGASTGAGAVPPTGGSSAIAEAAVAAAAPGMRKRSTATTADDETVDSRIPLPHNDVEPETGQAQSGSSQEVDHESRATTSDAAASLLVATPTGDMDWKRRRNATGFTQNGGGEGGTTAAKRRRPSTKRDEQTLPCAVCRIETGVKFCKYLPNQPWLSHAWRGARPGSMTCSPCYEEFHTETSGGR